MKKLTYLLAIVALTSCRERGADVQSYLDEYNREYTRLYYASSQASWKTNTEIREGDTVNAFNSRVADEALTAFTGSVSNIEAARGWLKRKDELTPIQVRQLEAILYNAGSDPQTVAPLVKEKIIASIAQTEKLFGFAFQLNGKPVTTNELDAVLRDETDLAKRLAAWE